MSDGVSPFFVSFYDHKHMNLRTTSSDAYVHPHLVRILSLSTDDLAILVELEPALVFNCLPWFVLKQNPSWVASFHPDWMIKNYPVYMLQNHLEYVCHHSPTLAFEHSPEAVLRHNKPWLLKHRQNWLTSFHPEVIGQVSFQDMSNISAVEDGGSYYGKIASKLLKKLFPFYAKHNNPFIPRVAVEAMLQVKKSRQGPSTPTDQFTN